MRAFGEEVKLVCDKPTGKTPGHDAGISNAKIGSDKPTGDKPANDKPGNGSGLLDRANWSNFGAGSLYWGLSIALANTGESFLLARSDGTDTLVLLVSVEILVFVIGLIATKIRPAFFDSFGPIGVSTLFIAGLVLSILFTGLGAMQMGPLLLVCGISAAICFGMSNVLNAYFLFDYCRVVPEKALCFNAVIGCSIATILSLAVSYTIDNIAVALGAIIGIWWYLSYRSVSVSTMRRMPPSFPFTVTKRTIIYLYVALLAISLACGLLPPLLFYRETQSSIPLRDGLLIALCVLLVLALFLASRQMLPATVASLARDYILLVATGCILMALPYTLPSVIGSATTAFGMFVIASVEIFFCAHYAGDPRNHPLRFWCILIVVQAVTAISTWLSMSFSRQGGDYTYLFLLFICIYLLLLFLFFFQRTWTAPASVVELVPAPIVTDAYMAQHLEAIGKRYALTNRESEVLERLCQGWTVPVIAKQMVVSQETVRTHVKHLYQKLDVHTKAELTEFVRRER